MFTKEFRTALINFMYLMLKKKHVTKAEIRKILLLFEYIWIEPMRKTKKNEKKTNQKICQTKGCTR